jgi:hypothetical protein
MAEWLGGGLQHRQRRFDSGSGLHVVVAQLVARNLAKVEAAGSNLVYDSKPMSSNGRASRFQRDDRGSTPRIGSRLPLHSGSARPL